MAIAYWAGQVTNPHALAGIPIIDLRGSANINDIHTDFHSYSLRARLDEANGGHGNQLIWTWPSQGLRGHRAAGDRSLRRRSC